jgi:hypothetical protein
MMRTLRPIGQPAISLASVSGTQSLVDGALPLRVRRMGGAITHVRSHAPMRLGTVVIDEPASVGA